MKRKEVQRQDEFADKLPPKLANDLRLVARDICPKCGGELDTGWECNNCGADCRPLIVPTDN